MKRINYIAGLVIALFLFSSCVKDWLEGAPQRSVTQEPDEYADEAGFRSALIGAYTFMADLDLYGEKATMYVPEFIIRNWAGPGTGSLDDKFNNYHDGNNRDNDDVRNVVAGMWTKAYRAIAQLNTLINHIRETDVAFDEDGKDLILGEALGLRAFLHLDILRFFGDEPAFLNPGKVYLPYVTQISNNVNGLAPCSYEEYIMQLRQDLDESQFLLNDIDPIKFYKQEGTGSELGDPDDPFWTARKRRFNYWAAVATQARLESWLHGTLFENTEYSGGGREKAARLAWEVIQARTGDGRVLFPLTKRTELESMASDRNYTMNSEHIFEIENSELYESVQDRYLGKIEDISAGGSGEVAARARPVYVQKWEHIQTLYNDIYPGEDWRGTTTFYWRRKENDSDGMYTYRKYINEIFDSGERSQLNRVSLIRIAEMYLLLFEGMPLDVKSYAREYAEKRGIINGANLLIDRLTNGTQNDIDGQISKEYRKEFYGEGQMFFYMKRYLYSEYTWPEYDDPGIGQYMLQLPLLGYTDFYPKIYGEDEE